MGSTTPPEYTFLQVWRDGASGWLEVDGDDLYGGTTDPTGGEHVFRLGRTTRWSLRRYDGGVALLRFCLPAEHFEIQLPTQHVRGTLALVEQFLGAPADDAREGTDSA
ncbi:hypothetical protein [Curtobacterium sp. SL109]|uniref:hypothetical protein n=1 Tax=Curtobacterium sp. SL109 TaxID=2994662 RepID=UPI0022763ECC|nr:hypothetical protein [Curtobacterium sp. SL109]MCY1692881.1 hypothetical protein [Curtobacterium sp. SL109]